MVKIRQKDKFICLSGIVLNHHCKKVCHALESASRDRKEVILDLKELEFIDEYGVIQLLKLIHKMQAQGIRVEFVNAQDKVASRFYEVGVRLWLENNLFSRAG